MEKNQIEVIVNDTEKKMLSPKLTAHEKRCLFAEEYLVDLNATQAAIRAGYSAKTARQQGARLLSDANVQNYISELKAKRQIMTEVSAEWVVKNLVEVANRCLEATPVRDRKGHIITRETPDGEQQTVVGFDSKGANQALKTLAEHLGMLKTNVNMDLKGGISLTELVDDGPPKTE